MLGHHPGKTRKGARPGSGLTTTGRGEMGGFIRGERPGGYGPASTLFEPAGNYQRIIHGGN